MSSTRFRPELVILLLSVILTPFVTATVLLGNELGDTQDAVREAKNNYLAAEAARMELNNQLWESRQKVKSLEAEIELHKTRYDEVTRDRERIREIAPELESDFLYLVERVGSLSDAEFADLCNQTPEALGQFVQPGNQLSYDFLSNLHPLTCRN